jgi:hypothetical protein
LLFITGPVDRTYTADISTPQGTFRDRGTATFLLVDIGTSNNIGNLDQTFTSDLASTQPAPSTSKDQ